MIRVTTKTALINYFACYPGVLTWAVSASVITKVFVENEQIDRKANRYSDLFKLL